MNSELFIEIIHVLIAVLSFSSMLLSFLNRRKINEIQIKINSRMDQLLESVRKEGKSEGLAERKRK